MKILAIGNSFSSDATRYLYEIAGSDGFALKVVNLYIGGCSLDMHYKNMNNDAAAYLMEFNGHPTGFYVSIKEALQSDMWDYVTLQQASHFSTNYETYTPYLKSLTEYVRFHAPKAKQVFHQTWAYENGSEKLKTQMGYDSHSAMFDDIKAASKKAAGEVGISTVIPAGMMIAGLVHAGIGPIYRDSFHLSLGVGRYAVAALWYKMLAGKSIFGNKFRKFDENISDDVLEEVHHFVEGFIHGYVFK